MAEHVVAVACGLAVSATLFIVARRGKRLGTDPHCGRCNYNLSGNTSGRCPECGAELAERTPRTGRRARRPIVLVLALATLLLTVLYTYPTVLSVKHDLRYRHYHWWPLSYVINDLDSPYFSSMAQTELTRRLQASELTAAQMDLLRTALTPRMHAAAGTAQHGQLREIYAELLITNQTMTPTEAAVILQDSGRLTLSASPDPGRQWLPHPNDHSISFYQSARGAIRAPFARIVGLRELRVSAVDDQPVRDIVLFGVAGVRHSGRELLDFRCPAERTITLVVSTDWYILPAGQTLLDHPIPPWQPAPLRLDWLSNARPVARVRQQATLAAEDEWQLHLVPAPDSDPPAVYTPLE